MIRGTLLLFSLLAFAACDSGTDAGPEITGLFNLATVNGRNLPATATIETWTDEILLTVQSGYIQINSDNSFTAGFTSSVLEGGQTVTTSPTDRGTWTQSGSTTRTIQLTYSDSRVDVGVIDENGISTSRDGMLLVFRK